jgi:SAM-dependent methyltransferase
MNEHFQEIKIGSPCELGPPVRIVKEWWPNWNIKITPENEKILTRKSMDTYAYEFNRYNIEERMDIISVCSSVSLKNDFPSLLNQHNARVVSDLAFKKEGKIKITDVGVGSGRTSIMLFGEMLRKWKENNQNEKDLLRRLELTILDPSKKMLEKSASVLIDKDVKFTVIHAAAHEITDFIEKESQDLVMEVASTHHYADYKFPFNAIHEALKPGGFFVQNEWCHSLGQHPSRFRKVLELYDWDRKEEDLRKFDDAYNPKGEVIPEPKNEMEMNANKQMIEYYKSRGPMMSKYVAYFLEGHCPAYIILKHLRNAGFKTDSQSIKQLIKKKIISNNPHQILPDSSLLMSIVAQK